MNTREILSLQLGHYSNFIGSHWWNIQETGFDYTGTIKSDINHDVLFREGLTNKREVTYTPRLLLVDLKGSLKTLPEHGELYEKVKEPATIKVNWSDDAVEVIQEDKVPKNTFKKSLDNNEDVSAMKSDVLTNEEIIVWSDFLYSRFHPRTVNIIKEFEHESKTAPFNVFTLGESMWKNPFFCDEFSDKIRNYMEECDSPQGFHIALDAVDGFGGLGVSCLDHLSDEYDKKSILTFASIPSYYNDYAYNNADEREKSTKNDSVRTINLGMCISELSEKSSLTVPICAGKKGWRQPGDPRKFKYINYNLKHYYESSAILASALDTVTMPYRLKNSFYSMNDFCADLSGHGRKIAAASVNLPFPLKKKADFIDCLDKWEGSLWQSITPNCEIETDKLLQVITLRGIPETRLKRPPQEAKRQRAMPAYKCESLKEMLTYYLSCTSYATASHVTTLINPLSTKIPFPNIFESSVQVNGDIDDFPRYPDEGVESIPVIAGCHSSANVGQMLETLHRESSRIKISRFHEFEEAGLEVDDFKDALEKLLVLRECYEESFE